MRIEETIEINESLREVFDYVSDVRNYPQWMAHALEVRTDAAGQPRQGDRFVLAIKSVGRRFETPYQRDSFEPDRAYTDRAVGGPIPDHTWHSAFHEVAGGTRFTRALDVESGGLLKLLEPLQMRAADRQLKTDLQTLKDLMEAH